MTTPDTDALAKLIGGVCDATPADPADEIRPEDEDAGVHQLVYSMLLWNSTHAAATGAVKALQQAYADYNDLRAEVPAKVASVIEKVARPKSAPEPMEQAVRLTEALGAVFDEVNSTSLASIGALSKREARAYLEQLPSVPRFVSARVSLTVFGTHGVPLDVPTTAALAKAGIFPGEKNPDPDDAAARLERIVRASDALDTHLRLEAWRAEGFPGAGGKKTTQRKKTSSKRTTRSRR